MSALSTPSAAVQRPPTDYAGQTYYGLPATKAPGYRWLIIIYFFVGGIASAAQIIATIVDGVDPKRGRPAVRAGRYVALAGALISPVLLVLDLHTPRRWYNMLRIYRQSSAMSIGSWALSAFGAFTGLAALGQALDDLFHWRLGRLLARLAGLPAAGLAMVVASYTGTLLSNTNIPFWSATSPHLSSLFGSSAISTGTAAVSLLISRSKHGLHRQLTWLSTLAGAFELVHALVVERSWRRHDVAHPLQKPKLRAAWYAGALGLGIVAPLLIHAAQLFGKHPRSRAAARAASLASILTLVGGFMVRSVLVLGGQVSAERPSDYFGITQFPGEGQKGKRRRRNQV